MLRQLGFPDWKNHRKTEQFVSAAVGSAGFRPSHKSARSSLKYGDAEIFGFGHVEASKNREVEPKGARRGGVAELGVRSAW